MALNLRCFVASWKSAGGQLISRAPANSARHFTGDNLHRSSRIERFDCGCEKDRLSDELELLAGLQNPLSLTDAYFINKAVSFCAKSPSFFFTGTQFHSLVVKLGLTSNVYVCSAVVDMYAKCGDITAAHQIFDEMPVRNSVSWNSLISGYLDAYFPEIALRLFVEMLRVGTSVSPFNLSSCLVGCSHLEDKKLGEQLHGVSSKTGIDHHVVVGTVLIDMYSKSGNVDNSKRVFDSIVDRNVITWTSMVTAYSRNKNPREAMMLAREMMRSGSKLNSLTYNSLLSSFSSPDYLVYCKQVHCSIICQGFESNEYLSATLATVYSKCSNTLDDFVKVCSGITIRDQVSWNAMIAGYCNLERGNEALRCFGEMRRAGMDGDLYTFTSLLGTIGNNSSFLEEGREVHAVISKTRYASSLSVQNGIVSMYARCGAMDESKRMFRLMPKHDVISWNSLLTACAHHGYGNEAVELFEEMRKAGKTKPDATSFLAVLSACSHSGAVNKGLEYFELLKHDALLGPPALEHYASVVDIFGRAGHLDEAEIFIGSMPIEPGPSVYKALLSACMLHGNVEVAERSARKLVNLWPDDSATYVMLSNILKTSDNWEGAAVVHKLISHRGMKKMSGCSWS